MPWKKRCLRAARCRSDEHKNAERYRFHDPSLDFRFVFAYDFGVHTWVISARRGGPIAAQG
ncbi:MAG: hypothetical protein WA823_15575, partial [Candidatus Acidiferrales bacterium]